MIQTSTHHDYARTEKVSQSAQNDAMCCGKHFANNLQYAYSIYVKLAC